MDTQPLNTLSIVCTSAAEHLGYTSLRDLASLNLGTQVLVIGGHMVSLHGLRWSLSVQRQTIDTDIGMHKAVVRTPGLTDGLQNLGYKKEQGNRFVRSIAIPGFAQSQEAMIDVLVSSTTSRVRQNVPIGNHLTTTEVPGLATALQRPITTLDLNVEYLDGAKPSPFQISIPDEIGILTLKTLARTVRNEDRDIIDIWRALEICFTAGIRDADFGPDDIEVRRTLTQCFSTGSDAIRQLVTAQNLNASSARERVTRIRALINRTVGLKLS